MADKSQTPTQSPAKPPPSRAARLWLFGGLSIVVLVVDLWTKAWAWETLRDGKTITIIESWFYYEFGFNTGSAFSLLRDSSYARLIFIVVTVIAVIFMVRMAMTLPTKFTTAFVAVALVSGGALGNLHDRLFRVMEIRGEERHGVVDFIKVFYWPDTVWPTFNVADIALVVGVALLLIFLTRHGETLDAKPSESEEADDDDDDDDDHATSIDPVTQTR